MDLSDLSQKYGKFLSNPPLGEEVVITGISGKFPESDNIYQFRDNLFNKFNMVTNDDRRWYTNHPEIPQRTGKLNNLEHFDAGFFGVHHKQVEKMDPLVRLFLETAIECVIDAGYHPKELEGSRTGVFVGACFSESEKNSFYNDLKPQTYGVTGCTRSMIPNRVSYYLKLKGPSLIVDTACSSSLYALEHAYKAIRNGDCDSALVGGTQVCLHPIASLQFSRLGVLSADGNCKVFDQDANGYARSEAISCVFLQKSKDSRRIYGTIVHAKTNCDGYKEQGITFPSSSSQRLLFEEFYQECTVLPQELTYIEAHGTGTIVGDPEELAAIDEVFTKGRTSPLLIGSVKSNIGHTEPSAGICSLAKCIIAMESGYIPPNVNFNTPKDSMKGIIEGRLNVVTEKEPFKNETVYIGIDSFGFGGGNSHVLLRWNTKNKLNNGVPYDDIPRLVCVSGRTKESVLTILDEFSNRTLDQEFVWLFHQIYKYNFENHHYRGFILISKNGEVSKSYQKSLQRQPIQLKFTTFKKLKWVLYRYYLRCPAEFRAFRVNQFLKKGTASIGDDLFNEEGSYLGSTIVQLGIMEIFKVLQIDIEKISGSISVIWEYFRNNLSLEQALKVIQTDKNVSQTNFKTNCNGAIVIGDEKDFLKNFLELIGSLYLCGHNPQLDKLYPKIDTPVSRATPMIAPLIKWNHEKKWFVSKFKTHESVNVGEMVASVTYKDPSWLFVNGHIIDGRNLFPATGYLKLVWETLAQAQPLEMSIMELPVVFENCRFIKATQVPREAILELTVMVQKGSGNFEVIEGGTPVVTGRVFIPDDMAKYQVDLPLPVPSKQARPLSKKDIYKELRLRSYNYKGAFRNLTECDNEAKVGSIKWELNWINFIDNMLQMRILQLDTRLLYVPTFIQSLSIYPQKHLLLAKDLGDEPAFPVYCYEDYGVIKSGAIEVRGLMASSIPRRRILGQPVLEKYVFVPFECKLSLKESLRVNIQILLENALEIKVKAIELIDEATESSEVLSPYVLDILGDLPLIQPDITIFSKKTFDEDLKIKVEDKKLVGETDLLLLIGSKVLQRVNVLQQALGAVSKNGFILSREPIDYEIKPEGLEIITTHFIRESEKIVLFRKPLVPPQTTFISVDDVEDFAFLPTLQEALKSSDNVVVYSQQPLSGVLGFVNCLRREPSGSKVKCVFTLGKAPKFDPEDVFYKKILEKNLAAAVYKKGQWGTYRHLLMDDLEEVLTEHCYVNVTVRGDLSSLKWIEGPLSHNSTIKPEQTLVKTYYSSLNFRDVMTASGRINADVITMNRLEQECVQGFEFSGRDPSGKRVMGMVISGALSTLVAADSYLLWPIPHNWSLEEAATVPVVYGTVIYALLVRGTLKKGQSILIHAGSGGIGIAAISTALHYGCKVFTTVGTKEKREFLLQRFPQLKDHQIGNSRDTSFEWMIKKGTNGRGVDIVLNSLAEEKLLASARCLAPGGRFMEIGKFDLANNKELNLILLEKEAVYQGVMLDQLFTEEPGIKNTLKHHFIKGILEGYIKPLPSTIFQQNEIEKAFRFMASGKHIGKVLVAIRKEENEKVVIPNKSLMRAVPRYYCDAEKVQIIIGGLGGFGLELADWLILRGARKLVLTSRSGVKTGYQDMRLRIWKSYGVQIIISTENIISKEGCTKILEVASKRGVVESIFNLAVVLKDALLENQTQENFQISFGPKALATGYLDELSRKLCPNLRDFVIFSSVSCGRGNAGQTNYGMANSVMERICEKRRHDGFPALAIEWGAIGEVGLVAEMQEENFEMEIGGTLQQRISNCLDVLDHFMRQKNPIVSSMVVAEKRSGSGGADNVVDAVANILGIRDLKTVSPHSTLAELGMDSMTAVEIKTTLEREFEVFLSPQDIRGMTFARLYEIREEMKSNDGKRQQMLKGLDMLLRFMPQETNYKELIINMKSLDEEGIPKIFAFSGLEGSVSVIQPLIDMLNVNVIGIQLNYENPEDTIEGMALNILPLIENNLEPEEEFHILCYSYGSAVALEVVKVLEEKGRKGDIIIIDGSPEMLKDMAKHTLPIDSEPLFQTGIVCQYMSILIPIESVLQNREKLVRCSNFEERINLAQKLVPSKVISPHFQRLVAMALYKRIKAVLKYNIKYKLNANVKLYKPSFSPITNIAEDYKLSDIFKNPIEIGTFEGDHLSILSNPDLGKAINSFYLKDKNKMDTIK